ADHAAETAHRIETSGIRKGARRLRQSEVARHPHLLDVRVFRAGLTQRSRRAITQRGRDVLVEARHDEGEPETGRGRKRRRRSWSWTHQRTVLMKSGRLTNLTAPRVNVLDICEP